MGPGNACDHNASHDAQGVGGLRWRRSQRMGYLCLALVTAHMVVLGLRGWIAPQDWPGRLPPISLLAAAVCVLPLILKLWRK